MLFWGVCVRVEIAENNNPLEFSEVFYEVPLSESVSAGTLILCVSANDSDSAENRIIEFSTARPSSAFPFPRLFVHM